MNNLPAAFLNSIQNITGFDKTGFIAAHENPQSVTSIRLNPFKQNSQQLIINNLSPVPWCSNGYYLSERPLFTTDPLFHSGAYYVQEASSMFLETAMQQTIDLTAPLKILDLCAAPGGKSTLIQSLINEESILVSNEVIKTRVTILVENITKWGAANVVVTNNDPKDFKRLKNYFDMIVVDAPCSGSGLFRKDTDAINEWSENNVLLCSQRQQRILADVLPALKDDGVLIYSTCSYSPQEDEDIADWLVAECKMKSLQLKTESSWEIVETTSPKNNAFGYRFYPDRVKGEGFFIAVFKKINTVIEDVMQLQHKKKSATLPAAAIAVLQPYLKNAVSYYFINHQEDIIALPQHIQAVLPVLQSALYIKKAGVKMGAVIRNELIPHHELAVSTIINTAAQQMEVDLQTALQYLRRQDIKLQTNAKGWALLTYCNLPIGWVKILPNRINNYYPPQWRIVNK